MSNISIDSESMKSIKIEIITSFYLPKKNSRKNELIKCLKNNLNSPYVNNVHLF